MERAPMNNLPPELAELQSSVDQTMQRLGLNQAGAELADLQTQMQAPDFWQNREEAAKISQKEAQLRQKLETWQEFKEAIEDLAQLAQTGDQSLADEIKAQTKQLADRLADLQQELRFTGPYDDHEVILNIYSGAGGTDAQNWAEMLQRMYTRWAESHGAKVELIDLARGDEAGVKSVTLKLTGSDHLYGKLVGEHGVHRLVRKSPFNSAGSRETSFARVDVLPVIDEPKDIELEDKDLKIDVFRSSGAGGQSVNTTDSAVRVTHLPTGISVAIQNERSQLQNKETALGVLRARLAQLQAEQHAASLTEIKGPTQAAEWGSQIRNYILDDNIVKDLRSGYETHDPQKILDGGLDPVIDAYLQDHLA